MKRTITKFLAIFIFSACAVAAQTPCDIEASINNEQPYLTTDAAGTNVRSAPNINSKLVKTLKSELGFRFHITASQGNWVRVDKVNYLDGTGEFKPLAGWIYAQSLFLKADSAVSSRNFVGNLYAAPNMKARLLLSDPADKERYFVTLLGCQGKWAKVSWEGSVGWLNPYSQCADLWDICGER